LMGPDEYSMIYKICESDQPIQKNLSAFPYEYTYWTIKAYDQFGSSIYADPIVVKSANVARPVNNPKSQEYLYCTGYELLWQKRISRTQFEYCFKLKLKNMTDFDVSNKNIEFSCAYDEVQMINNKVFFDMIPAGTEVLSQDSFIVRIDRLYEINNDDIEMKFTDKREGDFSLNGKIDFNDLRILSQYWLQNGEDMPYDIYRDGIINFMDFGILSQQWSIN
ncbi:MAG: dockerin type I domain-containing protein, partial [Phycisphaerales bacterium]